MPFYQNVAIDEASFLGFVAEPNDELLGQFVAQLSANEQANSFFEFEQPMWENNTQQWVRKRLALDDWYQGLSEAAMVAWEHAVMYLLDEGFFECDNSKIHFMEHGAVHFDVFEFAEIVFGDRGVESRISKMYPYRFHGVPPEIEAVEPVDRVFWVNHALLDSGQIQELIGELTNYSELLSDFTPSSSSVFESVHARRDNAILEAKELVDFLTSLNENGSMWYARIDC